MKKILLVIFTVLTLSRCMAGQGAALPNDPNHGKYAYAIRYAIQNDRRLAYLSQINTKTDEIIAEREIDPYYNNLTVDPDSLEQVWLSIPSYGNDSGRSVDLYDFKAGRVIRHIQTRGIEPMRVLPVCDKLYVSLLDVDAKNSFRNSGFEVYDKNTQKLMSTIDLGYETNIGQFQFDASPDKKHVFAVTWGYPDIAHGEISTLFKINTRTGSIEFQKSGGDMFAAAEGLAMDQLRNQLYLAALKKRPGPNAPAGKYVFILSCDDFSLVSKIRVADFPYYLLYVPSVDRLYVNHRFHHDFIEVIDCKARKVIGKIYVGEALMMSYAGNNKMYVSAMKYGGKYKDGLLAIDLKTNKIKKIIPGIFTGISVNYGLK